MGRLAGLPTCCRARRAVSGSPAWRWRWRPASPSGGSSRRSAHRSRPARRHINIAMASSCPYQNIFDHAAAGYQPPGADAHPPQAQQRGSSPTPASCSPRVAPPSHGLGGRMRTDQGRSAARSYPRERRARCDMKSPLPWAAGGNAHEASLGGPLPFKACERPLEI